MQAVICHDFNEAVVEDVPRPDPGDDEVLVEIQRVQLSVTECQAYAGMENVLYDPVRQILDSGPAQLFGHEFVGTVTDVGKGVTAFEVGDRVYAPGKIPCEACSYCEAGYEHFCGNKKYIGREIPGALAEYVALPPTPLCRVPSGVSDAEAAALQPLASALLCVRDAGIEMGDIVAVIGAGVMGNGCGQIALTEGAAAVIAIDVDPEKVQHADAQGMVGIDAREEDPVDRIQAMTDGVGADVVFEAVGGDQTNASEGSDPLAQAYRTVRSGGSIVQIGNLVGELSLTPGRWRSKAIRWVNPTLGAMSLGPNTHSGEHAGALVASGTVSISEYITHELDGLESFEQAVNITLHGEEYGAWGPAQIVLR